MLLTETQAAAIAWGIGGAVMVAGALLGYWLRRTERRGAGVAFGVLLFVGYAIAISRYANGTRVLLMQGDHARFVKSELRLYGSETYTFADGRVESLQWLGVPHIVINDTPRPLKLTGVAYGFGASGTASIAPFERRDVDGIIRHFGPGDSPPSQSREGMVRYWLSW